MSSLPPYQHPGPPPSRPELPEGAVVPPDDSQALLPPLGVPVWAPFLAALMTIVALLIVVSAFGLAGADKNDLDRDGFVLGLTFAQDLILVGSAIAVVWWLGGRPSPAAFGLRVPKWKPALAWAAGAYAAFWIAAIILQLIFGSPDDQELVTDLKEQDSLPVLIGFATLICIVAPLTEEFVFRGFLFRVLWERTNNVAVAAVVSGALFGLVHKEAGPQWVGVVVLGVLGALLCVVFVRTVSLLPCMMLHSFHNSISFAVVKELPWWGFLLLVFGSVTTTLAIALLATRLPALAARSRAPALSPS